MYRWHFRWILSMVIFALVSASGVAFEAYFSDASGGVITEIWEGRRFYIAVEDPFKSACGVDSFRANVLIFDYKTGAYVKRQAMFVETGYDQGVYIWDQGGIPVGDRFTWDPIEYRYPYPVGDRTITERIAYGFEHVTDMGPDGPNQVWSDGNWDYVDSEVEFTGMPLTFPRPDVGLVAPTSGLNTGVAKRFQFGGPDLEEEYPYQGAEFLYEENGSLYLPGRFGNNDTLVVLVEDMVDGRWGAAQMKIARTEAVMTTSLEEVYYGCGDIIVEIEDKDESLSSDRPDFVPFFVIVNPGSWNPVNAGAEPYYEDEPLSPTDFCALMRTGGVDPPIERPSPPSNPDEATITVIKEVEGSIPGEPWEFAGTAPIGSFAVAAGGGKRTFTVPPGTYTITEATKDNYTCTVNGKETNEVTLSVEAGDSATVTFVNTEKPIYLILVIDESKSIVYGKAKASELGAYGPYNQPQNADTGQLGIMLDGIKAALQEVVPPYVEGGGEIHIAVLSFSGWDGSYSHEKQDRLIDFQSMADWEHAWQVVEGALDSIETDPMFGLTATGDALDRARQLLDKQDLPDNARGVVNLLTDGVPTVPSGAWPSGEPLAEWAARRAAERLEKSGYELWTVGIGADADNDFLNKIVGPAPARNFPAETFEDVAYAERQKLETLTGRTGARTASIDEGSLLAAPLGDSNTGSGKKNDDLMPVLNDPIRWYNIYSMRYIQYPHHDLAPEGVDPDEDPRFWSWAPEPDPHPSTGDLEKSLINWDPEGHANDQPNVARPPGVARAVFYARETGTNTGVFRFNFGSLDQLQARLGFQRFPAGTTIAFYYVDPNDFSDMAVTTVRVGSPYTRSRVSITDGYGNKVDEVRLGEDGLYFRVEDGKQSLDDCLQESVLVHVCDVHGEDDSEYWNLDEILAGAGVFAHSGAMRLEPVWDAVGGYQLELDDQRFQAFNADTIFVRYNSVRYNPEHVAALGTGGDGLRNHIPPEIIIVDPRSSGQSDLPYYTWDVSFDTVQVYDFQVFDGVDTHIKMLDGRRREAETYRPSDQIYLELTDLDQNEDSRVAERISSRWDRPDSTLFRDSSPIWGTETNILGDFLGDDDDDQFQDNRSAKVFIFNPRNGRVVPVDLMETGPDTGIFTSTTGLVVNTHLGGREGDTIVAFYQDPSNHSDIAIKTIRVRGAVVDVDDPQVSFDQNSYIVGDEATITVTEPAYVGASSIANDEVLVVRDADGAVVESWDEIPAVNDDDQFAVSFEIPEGFAFGTWTVDYVDPADADRTDDDTAQVTAAVLDDVTGIEIDPEFLVDEVTFSLIAEPVGAVADRFTIMVYDLTGRKVAEFSDQGVDQLTWDGENLRSTAFIYVAVVESAGNTWTFRGPVYIRR